MSLLLGCIADDFTGATDLASMLVRHGMRTVQLIGVPDAGTEAPDAEAVVVALKSRTIPAADAVAQSLAALRWLRGRGARQILFKYCSTFDSTDEGNIGPVGEALLAALGGDLTIACPALPENGRTVYRGHLFVGDTPLAETHMRHHPLTPMRDSDLVRVLRRQSEGPVGLVPFPVVDRGPEAVAAAYGELRARGVRQAVVDALTDRHLADIGTASIDLPLIGGGSGVAMGIPAALRGLGLLEDTGPADALPSVDGLAAVLSGSCSEATLGQVAAMAERHPCLHLDPLALGRGEDEAARALAWAAERLERGPVLIASSAEPERVRRVQGELGRDRAGTLVEDAMAAIARGLVERGVRRLIVAGGETSGAVVNALGVKGLRIGPAIDPGVPWTTTLGRGPTLALALKSGNFGMRDFFLKAFDLLP